MAKKTIIPVLQHDWWQELWEAKKESSSNESNSDSTRDDSFSDFLTSIGYKDNFQFL